MQQDDRMGCPLPSKPHAWRLIVTGAGVCRVADTALITSLCGSLPKTGPHAPPQLGVLGCQDDRSNCTDSLRLPSLGDKRAGQTAFYP